MSDSDTPRDGTPEVPDPAGEAAGAALREGHAARARSAATRTAATCQYLDDARSGLVDRHAGGTAAGPVLKADQAVRTAAQAVAAFSGSAPDPAADSRSARNAAAAAALAAQTAQRHDNAGAVAVAAYRAAQQASLAAGAASAMGNAGRDVALNAAADAAEAAAVAAAERAGWLKPGHDYTPSRSDDEYTPSIADVMHLEH
ncbi:MULTISPECIES: hypothetical protein [unclassified Streptomyces]|uniref:hypothetical protein n=1 Tax=unclassified Streptomyces TaxID=2593676 RepID=UPI00383030FB